jgi:IS5 family transposase
VILLTPGNTNDFKPAQRCLELMPPAQYVIADKGYDSAPLRQWLQQRLSARHPATTKPQAPLCL